MPKIIVSLTSEDKNLKYLDQSINSINIQSLNPDIICLVITHEQYDILPISILEYLTYNNIEIIYADKDFKQHNAYFYSMKKYPDDIIITIDSVHTYDKNFIESLYNQYKEYPKCIHVVDGYIVNYNKDGQLINLNKWEYLNKAKIDYPTKDIYPLSYNGILYPPNILDIDHIEESLINMFINDTDAFLMYITSLKNIKKVWVSTKLNNHHIDIDKNIYSISMPANTKESIETINNLLCSSSISNVKISNDTLIVSFTSYPPRIKYCYKVLLSLLNLTLDLSYYHIILVLAIPNFPNKELDLPNDLVLLVKSNPYIDFLWYNRDIRSHKKLIPTLKEFPNNPILITDDDVERQDIWLETFYKDHLKYPEDVLIGISIDHFNYKQLYESPKFTLKSLLRPVTPGIVHNFGRPANGLLGTLYPAHTFTDERFYDEDTMMELVPSDDEMWQYVFNLMENKIIRQVSKPFKFNVIEEAQNITLAEENMHIVNKSMLKLYKQFPELKDIVKERQHRALISISYDKLYLKIFLKSLESLIEANNKQYKICLTVYRKDYGSFTEELLKYFEDNNIELIIVDIDLGVYNKYYYVMEKYPSHAVMVFNCNMKYNKKNIENLMKGYISFPYSIIANRGHVLSFNSGYILKYSTWKFEYQGCNKPEFNVIADIMGGVLYPPGSMGITSNILKVCLDFLLYEEIYFKYILNVRHLSIFVTGDNSYEYLGNMNTLDYKFLMFELNACLYNDVYKILNNTDNESRFLATKNFNSTFDDMIRIKYKNKTYI